MIVLKVIFYLFPILFILVSLIKLNMIKEYLDLGQKIVADLKKPKDERNNDLFTKSCLLAFIGILNFSWLIVALFTFNYEYALIMLVFSQIFGKLTYNKTAGASAGNIIALTISLLISIIFYVFLILNTFHLHIQLGLFEYVKNMF